MIKAGENRGKDKIDRLAKTTVDRWPYIWAQMHKSVISFHMEMT